MTKPKQTILYTRTGDEGYTRLLGQERVPKYDLRPEAYGTVDEATSFMGLVRAEPTASERTKKLILETQRDLWVLMGELATSPGIDLPKRLEPNRISWLESEIDKLGIETPPLTQFVLPGDTKIGAPYSYEIMLAFANIATSLDCLLVYQEPRRCPGSHVREEMIINPSISKYTITLRI